MWKDVGILRSGKELKAAVEAIAAMQCAVSEKDGRREYELSNLHTLGELVARSALARQESRGSHYRSEFPYRDDEKFQTHSIVTKGHEVAFEKRSGKAAGG